MLHIRNRRIGSFMLGMFLVFEAATAAAYSAADYIESAGSLSLGPSYPGYSNQGILRQGSVNSDFLNPGYANANYLNSGSSNPGYLSPVKPPCSLYNDCSSKKEYVISATDNSTCYVFYNECYLYNENCDRQNRNVAGKQLFCSSSNILYLYITYIVLYRTSEDIKEQLH